MKTDLMNGSVTKNLVILSWPTMIAMLFHVGFNIVDAIFVGRLGPEAIAGVSMVYPLLFVMFAIANGVGIGTTSVVARFIGKDKIKPATIAAEHSFIIILILSIIFTIIGFFFGNWIYVLMGAESQVLVLANDYGKWIFGLSIFMFFGVNTSAILRGDGDMKSPMIAMVVATILNLILDPILIFGLLGAPRLEIEGAAIATLISRSIALLILIYFVIDKKTRLRLSIKEFKFKMLYIKQILKVGIPSSINQGIMGFTMMILTKVLSYFGPMAIAAYGIGFRIESMVILPMISISMAVITIVGQNVGAGNYKRAEDTTWKAIWLSMGMVSILIIFFMIFPRAIFSAFTDNTELIGYGVSLLRIVSVSYIFAAFGINVGAAFQGSGNAMPALILTTIRLLVVAVPLALLFAFVFNWGLKGVWIAMSISSFVAAVVAFFWFKSGNWKKFDISTA